MDFEIMPLSDTDGAAVESTIVDAATVEELVREAAATGQRLYIRPVPAA